MEYIIIKDKLYVMGKATEIKKFFREKIKTYTTLKELIDSETRFIMSNNRY